MVALMCLRQSYEGREIAEVQWITIEDNTFDAITKTKSCLDLKGLADTNTLQST